ncbi:uncharacterized protein LOC107267241 [Cephus cinctus]|uniref:Uncharacterized protein LOC107267241 n=1 Tax=Cephus cinctus TaxID=211228 RepID=A0AAJ7FJ04_CEPCN|nr:uncharacterized protein LOC107267241 [Cephus cinctus]XP_015594170.1 uncharacterized protein LOC107267241 [Cephus cinctus]XP_015594171.1 uncharacterized protein LOC107267241 [Cephus cinctus]XP_015594172.1 uncharacterized protein LOC107267241 [Cephus cinctus]
MMSYDCNEYGDMILVYGMCGCNAHEAARSYAERFPKRARFPSAAVILGAVRRIQATGSAMPNHRETGAPRQSRTLRKEERIIDVFRKNPTASVRSVARSLGLPRSTVHKIIGCEKWHVYHYTRVEELKSSDYVVRREFCEWLLQRHEEDPNFIGNIMFTDELSFGLSGCWNTRNCQIWTTDNSQASVAVHQHERRFSVNLWAGIINDRLIGPFEFEGKFTTEKYRKFLQRNLLPLLRVCGLSEENRRRIWLQHNATRNVREELNGMFPERWIGQGGPHHWPPRSSDLTPMNFFLWEHMKSVIYRTPVETLQELHLRIDSALRSITPEMLKNCQSSLLQRARCCIQANGGHFEHLLH